MTDEPAVYVDLVGENYLRVCCHDQTIADFLEARGYRQGEHGFEKACPDDAAKAVEMAALRDIGIPFSAGPGWSPEGVFCEFRKRGLLRGPFTRVFWRGPGQFEFEVDTGGNRWAKSKRFTLFQNALTNSLHFNARFPRDVPIHSIVNQLNFLIEIECGNRTDWTRLSDIILGVQAVREIESADLGLAEMLYQVSAEVDRMIEETAQTRLLR